MKFWGVVTLLVFAAIAIWSWLSRKFEFGRYRHVEPLKGYGRRRKRRWRLG